MGCCGSKVDLEPEDRRRSKKLGLKSPPVLGALPVKHTHDVSTEATDDEEKMPALDNRIILLAKTSWEDFCKTNEQFSNLFGVIIFVKLFELSPGSSSLFSYVSETEEEFLMKNKKMHCQVNHVLNALSTAVANLGRLAFVARILQELGGRHVAYNMQGEYFDSMKIAVLTALEAALEDNLTEEHKAAWNVVMDIVCENMLIGFRRKEKQLKEENNDEGLSTVPRPSIGKFESPIRLTPFTQEDFDLFAVDAPVLTSRQKILIRRSWPEFMEGPNPTKNAAFAFVRLFVLSPESMEVFKFLEKPKGPASLEQANTLLKNVVMRAHIDFVVSYFDDAIALMDNMTAFTDLTVKLGSKHWEYGATVDFLKGLCEGFLFALEKKLWPKVDAELLSAWEAFLINVGHYWALGFTRRKEKETRFSISSAEHEQPKRTVLVSACESKSEYEPRQTVNDQKQLEADPNTQEELMRDSNYQDQPKTDLDCQDQPKTDLDCQEQPKTDLDCQEQPKGD